MKNLITAGLLTMLMLAAGLAAAKNLPRFSGGNELHHGAPVSPAKTSRDTIFICGPWDSGAPFNGQFESPVGVADWNGWTHKDNTYTGEVFWNVSNYHADDLGAAPFVGNLAIWCGYPFPACDMDEAGGYGNSWYEVLEWRTSVADPGSPTTVDWDFYISWDTELNYDNVHINYLDSSGVRELAALDHYGVNSHQIFSFAYTGGDYAGASGGEIILQIVFSSDTFYSDEDCLYPTVGACQVDDITVNLNSTLASFTDFEDGLMGEWTPISDQTYVGDFAMLRNNLGDVDPCRQNSSFQVTFVDDGIVVPGTGGTLGINWRYGPGGFIVTPDGGLAGPDFQINNSILSPVMPWPDPTHDGSILAFDAYLHEDLDYDSPQIFLSWGIRSTDSTNPDDIVYFGFRNRNSVNWASRVYVREENDISDLLVADRQFIQCCMTVFQSENPWQPNGLDGYPAPYVDNVRVASFPVSGPSLIAQSIHLAQDNFPAIGTIDYDDLGRNSCRFDMAMDISPQIDLNNDPGDSIVVGIVAVRNGSHLLGDPRLIWQMDANSLFDPYRTSIYGQARSGETFGYEVDNDRFAFDLPDSGFLFPGDEIHYCIVAQDRVGGQDIGTAILPADTTGFSDFSSFLTYDCRYIVRCLPSIQEVDPGVLDHPEILFWDDQNSRFIQEKWFHSLNQVLGSWDEYDYDVYQTNGASAGVGNGLGGRAGSVDAISGYSTLLYSSGSEFLFTLSNGDFYADPGNDIGLLDDWLRTGNKKNVFATGDNLVYDLLEGQGAHGAQFVSDHMGVSLVRQDIRQLISNQAAPQIKISVSNPVFALIDSWRLYGLCEPIDGTFSLNTFDAVVPQGAGQILAEFTDYSGNTGVYPYSAATLVGNLDDWLNQFISLPYDLAFAFPAMEIDDKELTPLTTPSLILQSVLISMLDFSYPVDTGPAQAQQAFGVSAHPNPFNPQTQISYTLPQKGHLSLKIFNLRGQLVRNLVDEVCPAGPGSIRWDGTDGRGQTVSTGIYFFEARTRDQTRTGKLTVVR